MNVLNEISDEEFIPFLQSLGVETYKKSFEWMLNDQDFSGVLRWLYENLDHNNALTAREEYRYLEIKKQDSLLSLEDLETAILDLQNEYEGLCLPGDKDMEEDINFDIRMQKERSQMLEKQNDLLKELLKQNELTKEELNKELSMLHSAEQQSIEDETNLSDESLRLAEEVELITDEVTTVIAEALDLYSDCSGDKEISSRFFTFGPFDAYRQTQALFRSHFDLYTSKKFNSYRKDIITNEDLQTALVEAKGMENRLTQALLAYIESKAALAGEQAKLASFSNYTAVHPSQIAAAALEAQSALELLEQEECILEQQTQAAVKSLVDYRTRLAVETTAKAALAVRDQVHSSLSQLLTSSQLALSFDRLVYAALRHELRTLQDLIQFAAHLRQYVMAEGEAVASRINSMHQICAEQRSCEESLNKTDALIEALCSILGLPSGEAPVLAVANTELCNTLVQLREAIEDGFEKKEGALKAFKTSTAPIYEYVYDGSTKKPNCWSYSVSSLSHTLRQHMDDSDRRVVKASEMFTSVKTGDKNHLRKLWQWFMTDPTKLAATMKGVLGKSYS